MIKTNLLEVIVNKLPGIIRTGYFECAFRERTYKTAMSFNYDIEVDSVKKTMEILVADNIQYYVFRKKKIITLSRLLKSLGG